jgi:gamma-glutamylcysteine synthetase
MTQTQMELVQELEKHLAEYKKTTEQWLAGIEYPQAASRTIAFRQGVAAGIARCVKIAKGEKA